MALNVRHVNEGGVVINVRDTTVFISGSIDTPEPGRFLEPFFNELHDKVIENNIKAIKIDITKLMFLNSSGIREFVDWIMKFETLEDSQKYTVQFLFTSQQVWQNMTLDTLVYLNPDLVSKEEVK